MIRFEYVVLAIIAVASLAYLINASIARASQATAEQPRRRRRSAPHERTATRRGAGAADILGWTPTRQENRDFMDS